MSNQKTIHLIWTLNYGGAENFLLDLVDKKVISNENVILCLKKGKIKELDDFSIKYGYRAFLHLFLSLFSKDKIFIIAWMYRSALMFFPFFALYKFKFNVQTVYFIRHTLSDDFNDFREQVNRFQFKLFYRIFDKVIFNSYRSLYSHFCNFDSSNSRLGVLYNYHKKRGAKEKNPLLNEKIGSPIILFACREHPMKGFDFFLDVVSILNERRLCNFLIVGEDENSVRLHKIKSLKNHFNVSNIIYSPKNEDLSTLLPYVDIILSTSLYGESFPNLGLDAQVFGCKYVASNVGDTSLLTSPEWLFEPGDLFGCVAAVENALNSDAKVNINDEFSMLKFKENFYKEMRL